MNGLFFWTGAVIWGVIAVVVLLFAVWFVVMWFGMAFGLLRLRYYQHRQVDWFAEQKRLPTQLRPISVEFERRLKSINFNDKITWDVMLAGLWSNTVRLLTGDFNAKGHRQFETRKGTVTVPNLIWRRLNSNKPFFGA